MDHDTHMQLRKAMRIGGPLLIGVGALLGISGFLHFSRSMGSFDGPPRGMASFAIGGLMTVIGIGITRWAYMGPAAQYAAREVSPAVTMLAQSAAQGMGRVGGQTCARCQAANAPDAKFCKACASPLTARVCAACGGSNAPDARFCDDCGKPLAA